MSNPWIEFVKKYAQENNISYACAIGPASKVYVKKSKLSKLDEMRKDYPLAIEFLINKLNRYKKEDDLDKGIQIVKQIINKKPKKEDFINYIKENRPKLYNIIFN
jgi:hypothetical protein